MLKRVEDIWTAFQFSDGQGLIDSLGVYNYHCLALPKSSIRLNPNLLLECRVDYSVVYKRDLWAHPDPAQ